MEKVINTLAFPKTPCSYTTDLPYLSFIKCEHNEVPIAHYHQSDKLKTIIYSHANAEDIGKFNIEALSEVLNANIILYDYSGYGLSTCREASESNCYKDIEAVYRYATINKHIKPENVVLYGRSIGTGVACHLAYLLSKQNICCKLILVSPFKSIVQVVMNLPYLPYDIFCIDKIASQITCQVLIIHGCQDKVTDYQQSRSLARLFPNLYKFQSIHGCGHHYIYTSPLYYQAIQSFLAT